MIVDGNDDNDDIEMIVENSDGQNNAGYQITVSPARQHVYTSFSSNFLSPKIFLIFLLTVQS